MDKIKAYQQKIDSLTVRERAMILLAILAVIFFLWDTFLMSPLDIRQKRLQAELDAKRAELNALNIEFGQLAMKQNQDPNAAMRVELETLREELAQLDENIQATAENLVEPARMPELLRSVINKTQGLRLTNLQGLGVTPLLEAGDGKQKAGETESGELAMAYKHGMQIRFRGDYLQTLEYLRQLEALQWGFVWDSIELEIKDYPQSQAGIRLYTLSLVKDWIKA